MAQGTYAKFASSEDGATAIEYALIAGIVSIAIVAALTNTSSSLKSIFNDVKNGFPSSGK
jgi:pilus assembly protein Flp/PilA